MWPASAHAMDANAGAVMLALAAIGGASIITGFFCGRREMRIGAALRLTAAAAAAAMVLTLLALALHRGGMTWNDVAAVGLSSLLVGLIPLAAGGVMGYVVGSATRGSRGEGS